MKCIVCGGIIPKENWWRKPKFCSRKCYQVDHKEKKAKKACAYCGKIFEYRKCYRVNYCSRKCRYDQSLRLGNKYIGWNGYVYIKTSASKYSLEHRHILSIKLGRKLKRNEHCHHINGIKTDNRPENLEIFACNADHINYHHITYGKKYWTRPTGGAGRKIKKEKHGG